MTRQALVSGAGLAELVRAAAENRFEGEPAEVLSLVLQAPLVIPEDGAQRVQVVLTEEDSRTEAKIYSQGGERGAEAEWTVHAIAEVRRTVSPIPPRLDLAALRARCTGVVDVEEAYEGFAATDLSYGASFEGIKSLVRAAGEVLAEVTLPAGVEGAEAYGVHPALLDAAFHAMAGLSTEGAVSYLPFAMDRLTVHQSGASAAWVYVRRTGDGESVSADVTLADEQGEVLVEVVGLQARPVVVEALQGADAGADVLAHAVYHLEWPVVAAPERFVLPSGRWIVVTAEPDPVARAVAEQIRAAGGSCTETTFTRLGEALPVEHVVCIWKKGEEAPEAALHATTQGLAVVQALAKQPASARMAWVTIGAVATTSTEEPAAACSSLWGLGRTVLEEHPELGCRMLDMEATGDVAALVLRELGIADDESQVAWRSGKRHVARLVRAPLIPVTTPRALRTDGSVLITGGLGALGLHVARWLVRRGVKHLVLTSRRGRATPGAASAVAELEGLGAQVTVAALDVANREALAAVLQAIPAERPLRGVIHAAGVVENGMLSGQSAERFARVMAPKVDGASHLDALTRAADLDFFVLFSSVASTLGFAAAGQGPYASANAFLDGLAAQRRARGLPAQSLAWGLWGEGGMGALLEGALLARLTRQGMRPLSPFEGIALLEGVLDRPEAALVLVPLDLRATRKAFAGAVPPLWRALVRGPRRVPARAARGAWAQELAALPSARRLDEVLETVRAEVARTLSLVGPERVAEGRPLSELGLDSLMAMELRNALGRRAGMKLPATLAFDYPTPAAIAKYLLEKILPTDKIALAPVAATRPVDEPIAIVGMGCRYPGGVTDLESFWQLLDEGVDAVAEVPRERWDVDALYDPDPDALGKMVTRSGGFVREVDQFDAGFFGVSPREATSMDPQQRLLLETSWEALERAGMAGGGLVGSNTGVFVGLTYQEYGSLGGGGLEALDGYLGTGSLGSMASGRISYFLGLQGPSMTVDTACSSSLVTVHLACQALRSGECSVALAGGVALMLTPGAFVAFSRLRGLAPDGRCKSFSAAADGVGWAEGCGMLVLERLSDAQRNGHPVLALIRGSAVNQDGRSNGITAPNGPSQEAVIQRALEQAGVTPSDVQYVECHGTGTSLGDPIEAQALGAVMSSGHDAEHPVVLGSVKSNLGHTQAAAGVAGIIKVVLALQHGRIPKNLHFDAPSPHIAWDELPVKVAVEAVDWPRTSTGGPRIAGVSAFGISGTNAHVVLEEAPFVEVPASAAVDRPAELVVLTGKSVAAVNTAASRLSEHLKQHPEQRLGDIAFSLATSRPHHEHRVAIAVTSRQALSEALASIAQGKTPAGAARSEVRSARVRLAWVFSGQGSQRLGMGRELHSEWPVFRDALEAIFAALDPHLPTPLRDVMWAKSGTAEAKRLDQTMYTQPALFALEVALSALWRSWGIEPALLAGHSIGELAAAHVAGVFSLEDAARLVVARGRLMQALPAGGAMVSIAASEADVSAAVGRHGASVSIAAINGPESVVVSGSEALVVAIAEGFGVRGTHTKRLSVSHAFHSPLVEPMLDEFQRVAESVTYHPAKIPLVSNLTGALAASEVETASYWVKHVRATVRFADGMRALHGAGATCFLELSPRATLLGLIPSCIPEALPQVTFLASFTGTRSEPEEVLEALGGYHAHGGSVVWKTIFPNHRRVDLPTYAWQRRRYWTEPRKHIDSVEMGLRQLAEQGLLSEVAMAALPELLTALEQQRSVNATEATSSTHSPPERMLADQLARAAPPARRALLEDFLRGLLADAFGLEASQIAPQTSLTSLGLTSVGAFALRNQMVRELGQTIPATVALLHPTLEKLSDFLARTWSATSTAAAVEPEVGGAASLAHDGASSSNATLALTKRSGPARAAFQQEQLWFMDQLNPGSAFFNMPTAVQLLGRLDLSALERSFDEIFRRHSSLRTTFALVDDVLVQIVAPAKPFTLSVVDVESLLETLSAAEREALVRKWAQEEAARPFDLGRGPLFRVEVRRLAADDHLVLATAHHIVYDAWSSRILLSELAELYSAFVQDRPPRPPDLPLQFAAYAEWQREHLTGKVLEEQLSYWRKQLEGVTDLEIPTDRPRPATASFRGKVHTFRIEKRVADELMSLGRCEHATLFMTLLAVFKTLLFRYGGQEKIAVDTPMLNRPRVELEPLIGFFANNVPLATDLSGDPSFRELLRRVNAVCLGAYAHQDMPLELLVAEIVPDRDRAPGKRPLVQVAIAPQPPALALELPGLAGRWVATEWTTARLDLMLAYMEQSDGILCAYEYSTDLFDDETVSSMAGHFQVLCESVVANPEATIATLQFLTDEEQQSLLSGGRK